MAWAVSAAFDMPCLARYAGWPWSLSHGHASGEDQPPAIVRVAECFCIVHIEGADFYVRLPNICQSRLQFVKSADLLLCEKSNMFRFVHTNERES